MGRRGAAFTVTELLVCVAIVGLLAAILLPVLAQGRERSKRTRCVGNLRQIGTAVGLYSADHDGNLPIRNFYYTRDRAEPADAHNPLYRYGAQGETMRCHRATIPAGTNDVPVTDYQARFAFDMSEWNNLRASWFRLEPAPTSALAWDEHHLASDNAMGANETWLLLRGDSSVAPIRSAQILRSQPIPGTLGWTSPAKEGGGALVFPGEAWPPVLEPIQP
jgi:type II secretory pathway pseudopilin PulG